MHARHWRRGFTETTNGGRSGSVFQACSPKPTGSCPRGHTSAPPHPKANNAERAPPREVPAGDCNELARPSRRLRLLKHGRTFPTPHNVEVTGDHGQVRKERSD